MSRKTKLSKILLKKYLDGDCTQSEKDHVQRWYEQLGAQNQNLENSQVKTQLSALKKELTKEIGHIRPLQPWYYHPALFAAVILIILGVSISLFRYYKQPVPNPITHILEKEKAYLVTSQGDSLYLTGLESGQSANLGGIQLTKHENGEVVYHTTQNTPLQEVKIVTPAAGQFQFVLPDGSKVHLNASTTLRFSSSFGNTERRIILDGEAYFEVAKVRDLQGHKKPFLVESKGQVIKVLGTHFNVCAYNNDSFSKTTLLEGSIELKARSGKKSSIILKPGEKVTLDNEKGIINLENKEKGLAVDWKEGYYRFDDNKLPFLLKRLSRWYDIDIEVDSSLQDISFGGRISRKEDLAKAIEILEMTNEIKTEVVKRRDRTTLIIKPKKKPI